MAIHSSVLAWRIPLTEKPDGLQSMEYQRVRHDWATKQNIKEHLYTSKFYIIWLAVPESERKLEICQNYNKVCSTLTDLLLWQVEEYSGINCIHKKNT